MRPAEVAARDVAHEEVHWKWKVDLRTRPILTQSSFLRVRGPRAFVGARRRYARVRDTGDSNNAPSIKRAHLLPVALNRQIDKGNLSLSLSLSPTVVEKRRKEKRRKHAGRKIGEYAVKQGGVGTEGKVCEEVVAR